MLDSQNCCESKILNGCHNSSILYVGIIYIPVHIIYWVVLSYFTKSLQSYIFLPECKQTGAELDQAHLKLGFDFGLIFCRFGLVDLVGRIQFCMFD